MKLVREVVLQFRSDNKLSDAALRSFELRTLVNMHSRLMHIISDTTIDLDEVEAEVLKTDAEPPTPTEK